MSTTSGVFYSFDRHQDAAMLEDSQSAQDIALTLPAPDWACGKHTWHGCWAHGEPIHQTDSDRVRQFNGISQDEPGSTDSVPEIVKASS